MAGLITSPSVASGAPAAASYRQAALVFGAAFVGLTIVVGLGWARPLDVALASAVYEGASCWARAASAAASLLFAGELSLAYAGGLALLCAWRRRPLLGLLVVGLLLATVGLEFAFKFGFYQPAPDALLGGLSRPDCAAKGPDYPFTGVAVPNTYPSGYAIRAAYFGLLLAELLGLCWPRLAWPARLALVPPLVPLAASRMAIAWHWPTDVLAGSLVGAAAACLTLGVGLANVGRRTSVCPATAQSPVQTVERSERVGGG